MHICVCVVSVSCSCTYVYIHVYIQCTCSISVNVMQCAHVVCRAVEICIKNITSTTPYTVSICVVQTVTGLSSTILDM